MNFFLNSNNSVFSTNKGGKLPISLPNKTRLLAIDNLTKKLSLNEQYNKERDNCQSFRFILNINPICTNALIISCKDSRRFLNDLGINGEIIYTPGHSDDSISLILDEGIALVGDLYDLNSAITFNDEKINNSWNKILSHNISKIYYGHHEQNISNIKKIEDTINN